MFPSSLGNHLKLAKWKSKYKIWLTKLITILESTKVKILRIKLKLECLISLEGLSTWKSEKSCGWPYYFATIQRWVHVCLFLRQKKPFHWLNIFLCMSKLFSSQVSRQANKGYDQINPSRVENVQVKQPGMCNQVIPSKSFIVLFSYMGRNLKMSTTLSELT